MVEHLHRRISNVERKLERLDNNTAPTVPKYDLTAPGSQDVMKFTVNTAYYSMGWVEWSSSGLVFPVYHECDIYIPQSLLDGLSGQSNSANWHISVMDIDANFDAIQLEQKEPGSSEWRWSTMDVDFNNFPPETVVAYASQPLIVTNRWTHLQFIADEPINSAEGAQGSTTVKINGTQQFRYNTGYAADYYYGMGFGVARISDYSGPVTDAYVYVKNVKVGRTNGGSDLGSASAVADFSGGTTGTCVDATI